MRSKRSLSLGLVVMLAVGLIPAAGSGKKATPAKPGLKQLQAVPAAASEKLIGIATFNGSPPSASKATALRRLGLTTQPMKHLPLAILYGTKSQIRRAVSEGIANDVYPNEQLHFDSRESRGSIRADKIPKELTGKGIGVAVVDSGIDATHPDLADHVTHNMKMVGPEYLGITGLYVDPNTPPGTLVVPIDQGPYNNSDLGSGHGTHVSGIVAADGTTTDEQVGVAPDAHLIGYSTGDVLYIFTIIAAFNDILEHHEEWGIRVVNNSWGGSFKTFDPAHPIHVASKALHDAGIVVSFSAGNSTLEMQINPWSTAPWVISVGSATVSKERSSFSSGGLEYDNSLPIDQPEDGHLRFEGDRIGVYHPDVSGPGTNIVSSGTPTGGYVGPTAPGGSIAASGTSMSSPHVAGLAALILQARPTVTPTQVREIMQVTATPMRDESPLWHSGYGYIDAAAAIELVRRKDFGPRLLAKLQAEKDAAVLAARPFAVRASDMWTFTAGPATVLGLETYTYKVQVPAETKAIKATVSYPVLPLLPNLLFDWIITVTDAGGTEVATSEVAFDAGLGSLFVDLVNAAPDGTAPPQVAYGEWTITLEGFTWARDPLDLLGEKQVSLNFVQLVPQAQSLLTGPRFVKAADFSMYFQPDGSAGPATTPEGCALEPGAPSGGFKSEKGTGDCHAGIVGYGVNYGAGIPAEFISEPLKTPLVVGGPSVMTLYLADSAQPAYSVAFGSGITYALDAVLPNDEAIGVAGGEMSKRAEVTPSATRGEYGFAIPPTAVPAGARLRLRLQFSGVYTSTMRMLYGGGEYADSGIVTGIGSITTGAASTGGGAKPAPKPKPKPDVKGDDQLPATGVAASATGYLLLLGASVSVLAIHRPRRPKPLP